MLVNDFPKVPILHNMHANRFLIYRGVKSHKEISF